MRLMNIYKLMLRNGRYFTALDCAAACGHMISVELLLDAGAKVDGGQCHTVCNPFILYYCNMLHWVYCIFCCRILHFTKLAKEGKIMLLSFCLTKEHL